MCLMKWPSLKRKRKFVRCCIKFSLNDGYVTDCGWSISCLLLRWSISEIAPCPKPYWIVVGSTVFAFPLTDAAERLIIEFWSEMSALSKESWFVMKVSMHSKEFRIMSWLWLVAEGDLSPPSKDIEVLIEHGCFSNGMTSRNLLFTISFWNWEASSSLLVSTKLSTYT